MQNEELQQTQKALEESRAHYLDLYDSAPVGYLTLNAAGVISELNLTAAKLFDIDRKNFINRRFDRFISTAYKNLWQRYFLYTRQNSGAHSCELLTHNANGTALFLHLESVSISSGRNPWHLRVTLTDVSDQKNLQKAELQKLVERYELVLDGAQDAIWDWDIANKRVHFSSRWKALRGFAENEISDSEAEWSANIHPDDKVRVLDAINSHFENKTPAFYEEYRIQCKDGSWKWILDRGIAKKNASGQVIRMAGSQNNITDHKNTELALRRSEERLHLAQKAGALGIFDQNLISGEMQWDKRLREIWGIKPDEPLHTDTCMANIHKDDRALVSAAVQRSLTPQSNGEYQAEYRLIRPLDGQTIWLAAYGTTRFNNGQPVRRVGFVQDISERKFAEITLRDTEIRLNLTMEELKAGYWNWDLNTNAVFFSPTWKQQLGFNDNELPNRYEEWENRLHPDDRPHTLEVIKNYTKGYLPRLELEFRLQHKNGAYRWIHSRGALLHDPDGQPHRMVGIHLDITEFKEIKELNQRRDEIEEIFRLNIASHTATAIAHELNQPLSTISYCAEVAQDLFKTGNQNSQKLTEILKVCSEQALHAGNVMRQLIITLHKGELINEPIAINIVIQDALELFKANGHLSIFKIKQNLATDLPLVIANGLQIQKVLINLFNNGLDSMVEGAKKTGTIIVTTRFSADDPTRVRVTVCDCGNGISDTALLKTMFQPFFTTKAKGLGMGLAISRSLIEAHGGEIWAEKNVGRGLSVHFSLPVVL